MTTRLADQFAEINKRAEEIKAELHANIMGKPLEDPQPTEAPKDIDFGMYGYPCGYTMKSLAHPEYPYAGTPWEWRVRK